jgi:hypothetical protein
VQFETRSHNYGVELMNEVHPALWAEVKDALASITDEQIKTQFPLSKTKKSLSGALNHLIAVELTKRGWVREAAIFNDPAYKSKYETRWRLDFAKQDKHASGVAIEVAFNHAEAIAWNLLKPVLSSQLNHIEKEFQTDMGIIIMAMNELWVAGGFDNAVGTFEQFARYLVPLSGILTVPLVLVGLKAPTTFRIDHDVLGQKKIGRIVDIDELGLG